MAIIAFALLVGIVHGAPIEDFLSPEGKAGLEAARVTARRAAVEGPGQVRISSQATLRVPPGLLFVPKEHAMRLLALTGQGPTPETLGMIFPGGDLKGWHLVAQYFPAGYVSDDDADWSADEILEGLKDASGRDSPHEIVGWVERPSYDRASHWLLWGLAFRQKHAAAKVEMNYNAYFLGREGFIHLRLVVDPGNVDKAKLEVRRLLGAIQFDEGKRYTDYKPSDRIAPHGVRELVGGSKKPKRGARSVVKPS